MSEKSTNLKRFRVGEFYISKRLATDVDSSGDSLQHQHSTVRWMPRLADLLEQQTDNNIGEKLVVAQEINDRGSRKWTIMTPTGLFNMIYKSSQALSLYEVGKKIVRTHIVSKLTFC
jgi:hypothetical protein